MNLEKEQYLFNLFLEVAQKKPKQFNRGCDSQVNFQISDKTIDDTAQLLSNDRNVVLVTNHQSYFEIETERYLCDLINYKLGGKLQAFLLYSSPAVSHNVGGLLEARKSEYLESGLNLLGVVRESDYKHEVYQHNITKKMEEESIINNRIFFGAVRRTGNLLICPFEKTLEGGRINPDTGKIKGIQPVDEKSCLSVFINCNCILLPCGIDDSYKVINPGNHHKPSEALFNAVISGIPSQDTTTTFRLGEFIDPISQRALELDNQQITHETIKRVASLISPYAQGVYSQNV